MTQLARLPALAILLLALAPSAWADEVEALIADLESTTEKKALEAAYALEKLEDPRSVEPLAAALKRAVAAKNVQLCNVTADALAEMGDERAAPTCIEIALGWKGNDLNNYYVHPLIRALGKFGGKPSVPALVRVLQMKGYLSDLHKEAAWALVATKDPGAADALLGVLARTFSCDCELFRNDPDVKKDRTGHRANDADGRKGCPDPRATVARLLGELGESAVHGLVKQLVTSERELVQAAKAKDRDEILDSGRVMSWTATALTEIGKPTLEPLLVVFDDTTASSGVRATIASILGKIGDPSATRSLKRELKKGKGWLQVRAAEALLEYGDPKLDKALLTAAKGRSRVPVTAGCYPLLIRRGKKASIKNLLAALEGFGSARMARVFATCGQPDLEVNGKTWLETHKRSAKLAAKHRVTWGEGK